MVFGAISTLYLPRSVNAGASLWGTDVRKVLDAAEVSNDASTKFAMGTNTSAHTVTADPYTSQGSDLTEADYGWAIAPSDMGSVAGAIRRYAAGNHVATLVIQSTTGTNPNGSLTMFAYRVGPGPGRTRTLLGSVTATGQTFDTTARAYTLTLALPEVVFAPDETIQYSFELNGQGVAVTGKNNSLFTGLSGVTSARVDTPVLETVAPEEGTFTGAYAFDGSGFDGAAGPGLGSFGGGYAFDGSGFVGVAGSPSAYGSFNGDYSFDGSGFTGTAPPVVAGGRWTPGGRDRFTARRTPKNRRRSR